MLFANRSNSKASVHSLDNEKKEYTGESFGFSEDEDDAVEDLTKDTSAAHVKRHPLLTLFNHKRVFSDCWTALLRLPFTTVIYKKTLLIVHKRIIPHLPQPTVLMDFLTDSYNAGGAISLLALKGLFVLITEHNLYVCALRISRDDCKGRNISVNACNSCLFFSKIVITQTSSKSCTCCLTGI